MIACDSSDICDRAGDGLCSTLASSEHTGLPSGVKCSDMLLMFALSLSLIGCCLRPLVPSFLAHRFSISCSLRASIYCPEAFVRGSWGAECSGIRWPSLVVSGVRPGRGGRGVFEVCPSVLVRVLVVRSVFENVDVD
jgi:hypothetical protein